jgi:lipopolysaccharide transport protein LptA
MPPRSRLTVERIRNLRRALLALALLLAAGLAALYYIGRAARPDLGAPAGDGTSNQASARSVGRGFDHTVTQEGKPLLRIRGKRDRRDAQGNLLVEEVLISAFQEDGTRYEIAADVATYNLEKREARLRGNVSLAGPQGFTLRTDGLVLKNGGRLLESEQPVRFQYGTTNPLTGRARRLGALLNRGEFVLRDGVTLRAQRPGEEEPFTLGAERLVFDRNMHQLRADEKVMLRWGKSHLRADRIAAHLSPDDHRLQFVRGRWKVRAVFFDQDPAGRQRHLIVEGDSVAALLDEGGRAPTRLEVEGPRGGMGHLRRAVDGAPEAFDVTAPRIQAVLLDGRLTRADAAGGVTVVVQEGDTYRRVVARNLTAELGPDGTVSRTEAQGGVVLSEGRQRIAADRVVATAASSEAFGDPVVLTSERGELRAPRVLYTATDRVVHGVGGVEATMSQDEAGPLSRTPMVEGDEPIRVQAEEGFWREEPQRSFVFLGKARAWSGDRVLRADQIRGEVDQDRLTASGNVEAVWFVAPEEGGGGTPRRMRVQAKEMLYDERAHQLEFSGDVRVVDGQRTLASRTLEVQLDEEGEAKRMIATGDVVLEAPAEGRKITAQRADHDLRAEQVVFQGAPVVLEDAKGGTLRGAQAVYSTATGKVRVTGAVEPVPTATPTP